MPKRIASCELNHDNWNNPEKAEKAGTFQRASTGVMNQRVIKVAQRTISSSSDSPGKGSPFSGLKDFKMTATTSSSSPFSFLSHVKNDSSSSLAVKNGNIFNESSSSFKKDIGGLDNNDKNKDSDQTKKGQSEEYYSKLRGLNESVADWIKMHVNKNPLCDLTPVFKDYECYLKEIEKIRNKNSETTSKDNKNTFSSDWDKASNTGTKSSFPSNIDNAISKTDPIKPSSRSPIRGKASTFLLGSSSSAESKKNISEFTSIFAKDHSKTASSEKPKESSNPEAEKEVNSEKTVNPFISQLPNKPSIFASSITTSSSVGMSLGSANANSTNLNNKGDDDDYQPPKPVFKPIQEDGAVYSKRCKVFVRKDSAYQDRGVGNLFLKPVDSGEKTQLIVRAETSIGNLLLNCLLSSSMSPQKTGSNNVMIACLPTPESEPPPVPVLLKVKTSEDADELLEKLKELINKN